MTDDIIIPLLIKRLADNGPPIMDIKNEKKLTRLYYRSEEEKLRALEAVENIITEREMMKHTVKEKYDNGDIDDMIDIPSIYFVNETTYRDELETTNFVFA